MTKRDLSLLMAAVHMIRQPSHGVETAASAGRAYADRLWALIPEEEAKRLPDSTTMISISPDAPVKPKRPSRH